MAENLLHGLVSAVVVLAILALGRIRDPTSRLRFWLLAASGPALLAPLFAFFMSFRQGELFRDRYALFSGEHVGLVGGPSNLVTSLVLVFAAFAGLALYLRDLLPFLFGLVGSQARARSEAAPPAGLANALAAAAAALETELPRLRMLATRHPVLACRGWRRPLIVVSTGLLDILSPDELEGALAHEIAHARHRDPAWGWILVVIRGIFCFNPFLQGCLRAAVHELERRADRCAALATGKPETIACGLRKLADTGRDHGRSPFLRAWHGFRRYSINDRLRSLGDLGKTAPPAGWTLAASAIGLGLILFLTVA